MTKPKTKSTKKSPVTAKKPTKPRALSASAKQSLLRPRGGAVDLGFEIAKTVRAAIGLRARIDPTIEARFASLIAALKNRKAPPKPPAAKS